MIKKLMSATMAVVATLGLVGVVQSTATYATDESGPDPKVFVCKYVGTPGVDERLQTGDNPISVSSNSTSGAMVGSSFADAQGRSLVLKIDDTPPGPEGDPDVTACPPAQVATPNTAVNAVCVPSEQVVRLTFVNSGKAESNISVNGATSKVAAGATVNVTAPITGATVNVTAVIDGKSQVVTVTCPAGGSGSVTTLGGQGQTTATKTPVPTVSGRGSVVASLPVTSGSSSQIVALTVLLGSALAGAATYVVRSRSGFSL